MSSSLRLTLITMTVGGGFTGVVLTSQFLFSSQVSGAVVVAICLSFVLLNGFTLVSGLLFVQNARRLAPLVVALAIQIPVLSSPVLAYQFATGLYAAVGIGGSRLFATCRFGSQWQFNILQSLPWGVGVNVVPVVLLLALVRSSVAPRDQVSAHSPPEAAA